MLIVRSGRTDRWGGEGAGLFVEVHLAIRK